MSLSNSKAFTLIEVVLAVTIMAFLSFITALTINKSIKAKEKIQTQVDQNASVHDVLNFMARDIELAFNYRDIDIQLYNMAIKQKAQTPAGTPTPTPNPNQPVPTPKQDVIVTHFIGEEDKLNFSSLSYIRTSANSPFGNQAEVGYYLDSCSRGAKCLWRRISPYIDKDVTTGGSKTPLLGNVKSLSFRYLGPGFEEEWSKNWRSDGNGAESMSGNFPYAVEINLEVEAGKNKLEKNMKVSKVVRIQFSNNKEKTNAAVTPTP